MSFMHVDRDNGFGVGISRLPRIPSVGDILRIAEFRYAILAVEWPSEGGRKRPYLWILPLFKGDPRLKGRPKSMPSAEAPRANDLIRQSKRTRRVTHLEWTDDSDEVLVHSMAVIGQDLGIAEVTKAGEEYGKRWVKAGGDKQW